MAISSARAPSLAVAARNLSAASGNPRLSSRSGRPNDGCFTFASLACGGAPRHEPIRWTAMEQPTDRQAPPAPPATSARPEPGEPRRVLDHPPSERYAAAPPPAADPMGASSALRAVLVALVGAAIVTFLGGPLSVTIGIVGVAAVIGWVIGSIVRPSLVLAVGLAIGSIALGLVGVWLFAGLEGGVLSLPDYLGQVHGPLVVIELAVAGLVAAATVR